MTEKRLGKLLGFLIPGDLDQATLARQGLQRLLLLRSLVTLLSAIGLIVFQNFSSIAIPQSLIIGLILTVVASIFVGFWRLKVASVISQKELFCHLLVDAVILFILLLNTGGASNPLISYLLVLLAVTATLLPASYVYTFATGGIFAYTFFLILELGADHSMEGAAMDQDTVFELHLVGMWIIFLVSAVLISVFLTRMATAIRERELILAKARENEMRNEQLVAIGTLAAGTAHALGTPLSTMAVLLTDLDKLEKEQLGNDSVKEDISVLNQQVTRCKDSLSQLIRYYHKDKPAEVENMNLSEFVSDIKDYITNIHPMSKVEFHLEAENDPMIAADLSLKHAVINIIENGIKAAREKVEVNFKVDESVPAQMEISINDDGPGIPGKVMEHMGEPFISTRKDSMGLGIFLANAAVQRLGGTIEMFNLKIGGALTLIRLPLPKLRGAN
jgi:two-component system sensor histidine kinase RegB